MPDLGRPAPPSGSFDHVHGDALAFFVHESQPIFCHDIPLIGVAIAGSGLEPPLHGFDVIFRDATSALVVVCPHLVLSAGVPCFGGLTF